MTTAWLQVVGVGEDGLDGLGGRARAAVDGAELLVGGRRHLAMVQEDGRPRLSWTSPLAATLDRMAGWQGRRCTVLASGDPLWFGIGRLLLDRFGAGALAFHPGVSAFALAAARLGWPLEACCCVSVHGRPVDGLRRHLVPGERLLVLTGSGEEPARILTLLRETGLGLARVTVLERLGGPAERRVELSAADPAEAGFAELNLVALDLRPCRGPGLPRLAGLPDASFLHDGQLTKSEVRSAALARLAPQPGRLLWDVGAGCGSVAIEWSRAARAARAIAIERDPERARRIETNARRLGVPELRVVEGQAPDCLAGLEAPEAAFVGGGLRAPGLLERVWGALPVGGRLVAHAVTLSGEQALLAFHERHGGDLVRLAVSRAEPIGGVLGWRSLAPVTQLAANKPCAQAA